VPNIKTPGYFIVGDSDEIIPTSHTLALYKNYKSKKKSL
jgi:esterase/lipase